MIHRGHQTSTLHKLPRELWGTSFFPWLWLWQLRSYNDDLYLQGRNFPTTSMKHIGNYTYLPSHWEHETCLLKQSLFQFPLEKNLWNAITRLNYANNCTDTSQKIFFNRVIKMIYLYKTRGQTITLALDLLNRKRRWNNDFLNLVKNKLSLFKL